MVFGFIYKIQFPNWKHYIGLTERSIEQRKKEHICNANSGNTRCVYNALRKYNMIDTLELIEIDTAETIEELCEKEIRYIKEYNSYYMNRNGYNMTHGGEGSNGYVYTEQDNTKNSERQLKYYEENPHAGKEHSERLIKYFKDPEARQKNSDAVKKFYEENPEARQQLSEAQKKRFKENPEARQQLSEAQKKRFKENPEAREKCSDAVKKYYENPEAREKCSEVQKKRFENPEARQQLSEAQKKRFENPEARQQLSEVQKKRFENPEARQQTSEGMKKYYEENPEARQKLSDGKGKNKPFDVFTKNGTFIKTFTYQFEAIEYLQKEHHITSTIKIHEVLAGRRKSSAGFVFTYKEN